MELETLSIGEELFIDSVNSVDVQDAIAAIQARLSVNAQAVHIYTESLRAHGRCVADSMETYLGAPELQSSHLKKAMLTPFHYHYASDIDAVALQKLEEDKEKGYFNLGTFLHQCILEPTLFSRAIVEPRYSLASKEGVAAGIAFWEGLLREEGVHFIPIAGEGKIDQQKEYLKFLKGASKAVPVSEENHIKIKILKKHLDCYAGGIIFDLLKHSKREISFYGAIDGLPIKVRPDAIQFAENIGVDAVISIKSTACEDLRAFYSYCARYHYDLSEALYQDVISMITGREFRTTITIMLQTVEPYAVAMLIWNGDDIARGREKYRGAIETIKRAKESGTYPGYEVYADNDLGMIEMELPRWNSFEGLNNK